MATNKNFLCILSNFVETWWSCSTHGYYNFTKFQQNWIKQKKVFICAHLTEVSSVKVLLSTTWIRPKWSTQWSWRGLAGSMKSTVLSHSDLKRKNSAIKLNIFFKLYFTLLCNLYTFFSFLRHWVCMAEFTWYLTRP